MAAERPERLYRFDPLDESGVFLGLGVIQCALVGGGLVAGVGLVSLGAPLLGHPIERAISTTGAERSAPTDSTPSPQQPERHHRNDRAPPALRR